jgi:hypothetical protein
MHAHLVHLAGTHLWSAPPTMIARRMPEEQPRAEPERGEMESARWSVISTGRFEHPSYGDDLRA